MKTSIPYGKEHLAFEIPDKNFLALLTPAAVKPHPNPEEEILSAIDTPIGCPPLEQLVGSSHRVNIIIDDMTRPTPVDQILPPLTQRLLECGVKEENIKIVVALGSHRYMTEDELCRRAGEEIYNRFGVFNSEFKKKEDLMDLGNAPDGTRVWASKIAMDSDIRIGVGNIVPHPTLGWGGGAKILYPGIAGEETVTKFHMQDGDYGNQFGKIDNPIRKKVETWVDTIGLHFLINTVLTKEFEIYRVVAGHYVDAHRRGVEYAKEVFGCKLAELGDAVVVSSHPADQDYWQSGKAITASENAIKPHGTVIHVSPNYEGLGPHPARIPLSCVEDPMQHLKDVLEGRAQTDDLMAVSSAVTTKARAARVRLLTVTDGFTQSDVGAFNTKVYPSSQLQKVIDDIISENPDFRFVVITHGAEIVPYID